MPPSSIPSDSTDLLATVENTLAAHHMLDPGDRVLVGVSGGPDSMALLHLLSRLAPDLHIRLGVAHLNHCLRGSSADRDAEVVRQTAAALNHPGHIGRARVMKVKQKLGLSLEDAARRVRYAFFRKTMTNAGYHKLALGHHMDDNAEQMLMALIRGAGPRGLSGIAPVRGKCIIRPLINARRSQIDAFVAENRIPCILDESNDDHRFVRNRIRHQLMPHLAAAYNPRIVGHLNRLADVIRSEESWIEDLTTAAYKKVVISHEKRTLTISADAMGQTHPALTRRLVRMAIERLTGTLRRISFSHVQSVMQLLAHGGSEKEIHLPGGIRARRTRDRLTLTVAAKRFRGTLNPESEKKSVSPTEISTPFPETVDIPAMGIGLRFSRFPPNQLPHWADVGRNRAHFDVARLSLPLTVRPVVPGDRFTPLGAAGSQKVKKFFIDHRILKRDRGMTPVLTDNQRIIWLMGHRIDDHVKVTAETAQVLSIEFFLLDTR